MTFLERYNAGEHQQVWKELQDLDDQIRHEPLYSDAYGVAQETMRRVKHNAQRLEDRLKKIGYRFTHKEANSFSGTYSSQFIKPVENYVGGTLPLSLQVFYEQIDYLDFTGSHPDYEVFQDGDTDALVIHPLEDPYETEYSCLINEFDWEEFDEEYDYYDEPRDEKSTPFFLEISPDAYHKVDVSGGPPYGILLPNRSADGKVEGLSSKPHIYFVDYLRKCFELAGFPDGSFNDPKSAELLSILKKDFLEF